MTHEPSPKGSNPLRTRLIGEAAIKAGRENNEAGMEAAGHRALRAAERMEAAVKKARAQGKFGTVEIDGEKVIVER